MDWAGEGREGDEGGGGGYQNYDLRHDPSHL